MSDTLGSVIDKLTIVNLKLWFVQDRVFKAAGSGEGLDADTVQKLSSLNLERNLLITEIDEYVAAGKFRVDKRIKLT